MPIVGSAARWAFTALAGAVAPQLTASAWLIEYMLRRVVFVGRTVAAKTLVPSVTRPQ